MCYILLPCPTLHISLLFWSLTTYAATSIDANLARLLSPWVREGPNYVLCRDENQLKYLKSKVHQLSPIFLSDRSPSNLGSYITLYCTVHSHILLDILTLVLLLFNDYDRISPRRWNRSSGVAGISFILKSRYRRSRG